MNRGSEGEGAGSDDADDGGEDLPLAERTVMVASAVFTITLLAFAVWQAATAPGAIAPSVGVSSTDTAPDGAVIHEVELRNPGGTGLLRATVTADCDDPPVELEFENVPAGGRRVGTIVCPPGTTDPGLALESWIRE